MEAKTWLIGMQSCFARRCAALGVEELKGTRGVAREKK
jgi:hypothetical protein